MLDLSRMNTVSLALLQHPPVVSVGGGCTWAAVDAALQPHGLAVPAGLVACALIFVLHEPLAFSIS